MNVLKLLSAFLKVNIQMSLAYRADTIVNILLNLMWLGWELLSLSIIFNNTETIGGWDFWQLGFMFSLWKMSHGLHEALFIPFRGRHDEYLRQGDYDSFLIRPVHPIIQILARCEFGSNALAEWLPSVAMFFITASHVTVPWNAGTVAFLFVLLLSGAVIEWAVYLFISSTGFWFIRTNNLRGIAGVFLFRVANYPLHIYGRVFPFIMTFIFPFAFMAYYPTHYFFGVENTLFSAWLPLLTPLAAALALAVACGFWSLGVQKYQSSGT